MLRSAPLLLLAAALPPGCGGPGADDAPPGARVAPPPTNDVRSGDDARPGDDVRRGDDVPPWDAELVTPLELDAGPRADGGACLPSLAALGVPFAATAARGVVEAIEVKGPIGGVLFASGTATTPMGDPVACAFVEPLRALAALLLEKGFVRVGTLGSYCYRCCCAWSATNDCRSLTDPEPQCGASGYSNHAWGRALDIRYLYKANGARYDVNDDADFTKAATTDTCGKGLAAQTGRSRELYELVCEMGRRHLFSTMLTPNYNAAHRNHFHLDIGRDGPPSGFVVRRASSAAGVDTGGSEDHCGAGDQASDAEGAPARGVE